MNLQVKNFLYERKINELYHFTKIKNLENILNNGLLSINRLQSRNIRYSYNDEIRLDEKLNAICISITFPNYKMFYKYRKHNLDKYCVLELDPKILYEKKCLFCKTNAASNEEKRINDFHKEGFNGLKRLFYDDKYMDSVKLGKNYTTDPQAEILVLEDIEIDYIKSVNFYTLEINFPFDKYCNMSFCENKELFKPRSDHQSWKNSNNNIYF